MSKRQIKETILFTIRQLKDPYYQGFAAQVAFYFMLSIIPLLILLSQLLGLFSISVDLIFGYIDNYFEGDIATIFKSILLGTPSGSINITLLILALWAASKAQFSLMRIANYTLTGGKGRGYVRERIRAVKTIIITIFTIAFSVIILVYGDIILDIVISLLTTNTTIKYTVSKFWLMIRWPVAMALYFLMVSYNYYVLPSEKVIYRKVVPGSIFASIAMLVMTYGFSIYTTYIVDYDVLYGSLASIVALMFWFFIMAWILGIGLIINRAWDYTGK